MRLSDLAALYLVAGATAAFALYRRAPEKNRAALINSLTAIPLWPIWAPIAWTAGRETLSTAHASERVQAVRQALDEGVASVAGTPLQQLLNQDSARGILDEVERIASRHEELVTLLARDEFSRERCERKLEQLEQTKSSARVRASARLHLENVRKLHQMAERDARALDELSGLVAALRTQLVLVRLSGSSGEGVGDIVSELWARIESLSEVSDDLVPPAEATA